MDMHSVQVAIGGRRLASGANASWTDLMFEVAVGQPDRIELRFESLGELDGLQPLAELEIDGPGGMAFRGHITGFRHSKRAGASFTEVVAEGPLRLLRRSEQVCAWFDSHASDVVADLLQRAGVRIGDVESTSGRRAYLLQHDTDALEFVNRLGAQVGKVLRWSDGAAFWTGLGPDAPEIELGEQDMTELELAFDAEDTVGAGSLRRMDLQRGEAVEACQELDGWAGRVGRVGTSLHSGTDVSAVSSDLGGFLEGQRPVRGRLVVEAPVCVELGWRVPSSIDPLGRVRQLWVVGSKAELVAGMGWKTTLVVEGVA